MAGFHSLDGCHARSATARAYKPQLQPGLHKIIGFARRTSHAAVTYKIAAGMADAGLGIDFVSLAQEHYQLVSIKSALQAPAVEVLRRVLALSAVLPWWHYSQKKPNPPKSL